MHPSPNRQGDWYARDAQRRANVIERPTTIAASETWRGDTITVHRVRHEVTRELYRALEKAAASKRTTVDELVFETTDRKTEQGALIALRNLVRPYLPHDFRSSLGGSR